ncbi:LysE family transporter [Candidatus Symbiopectobacterium sp. NZEC127]|uniref:LysE family translocator n=1 Tax=Candidatus Symbiopectobacterium sp. NZEC127 TaxID=2820472 RepID=UPI00222765A6|nr:LysE family transporter [Candidatus Symbiopectobacterium sp. NZEC127]MCW2486595.1 LysE family transporter [Candidatus Symbiopectobacterium sp. NZEC127]
MLLVVLNGILLSLSLCLDLGMVNTAIINRGMRDGPRAAFMIGFGSCFGDLVYAALSAFGLAVIFTALPVRWALWIGGGAILLWMTWNMARMAWRDYQTQRLAPVDADVTDVPVVAKRFRGYDFLSGMGMALASPTALLWFAAIGGSIIAQSTDGSTLMVSVFLSGFFIGGLLWTLFLAGMIKYGRQALQGRLTFYCYVISALLFAYFSVQVIYHGYQTLLIPLTTVD